MERRLVLVLGIETSCDETSAAVLDGDRILSNLIYSQLEHSRYGGVVPELASRAHIRRILPTIQGALLDAKVSLSDLEGIAVTCGPGLVGSLLVGLSVAKAISFSKGIPLIGIHHLEGHIFANFLEGRDLSPPFLSLVVSGGHTELIFVPELGRYEILSRTRDDAAGEAFDKVAKILGLIHPGGSVMGGPLIAELAEGADPSFVSFPRGLLNGKTLDFSFSGLKTAVLRYVNRLSGAQIEESLRDIAASFQAAVIDVLVEKSIQAALLKGVKSVALAGGVAANLSLREQLTERASKCGISVFYPSPILCTDNAAMIAAAGTFRLSRGERSGLDLNADPRLKLITDDSDAL